MAICTFCGKTAADKDVKAGICAECRSASLAGSLEATPQAKSSPDRQPSKPTHNIILTTATEVPKRQIAEVVQIVGSEAALGLNVFKDVANNWRDLLGGRSGTSQKAIKDARLICLQELRIEASNIGADAVIAVRFDFSEISTSGPGGIFFVAATGTAVKLEP